MQSPHLDTNCSFGKEPSLLSNGEMALRRIAIGFAN
jgi:hypothetical protein